MFTVYRLLHGVSEQNVSDVATTRGSGEVRNITIVDVADIPRYISPSMEINGHGARHQFEEKRNRQQFRVADDLVTRQDCLITKLLLLHESVLESKSSRQKMMAVCYLKKTSEATPFRTLLTMTQT